MAYLLTKETYVGERENGKYHGQGTLTLPDGDKYVGEWKNGKFHGQGTRTLYDGSKFVGIWKDNRRWKGKSFDEEGKEIGEYVNGEEEIYFKPSF